MSSRKPNRRSPARPRLVAVLALGLAAGGILPAVAAEPGAAEPGAAASPAAEAGRSIVLRPRRIDLEVDGRVVRSVGRPPGPLDLATVTRLAGDPRWASVVGTVVTLRAGLMQAPDTHLVVAAPAVTAVRLVSGPGTTSWIRGSRARVDFHSTEVLSWDEATGTPAAPSPHRGFVAYTNGSTVEASATSFTSLGRQEDSRTGVTFARSATRVVDSRFTGNEVGLTVRQPSSLEITRSEAAGSASNGIEVEGSQGGVVSQIASRDNHGAGVVVSHGGAGLGVHGAVVERNGGGGIRAEGQQQLALGGVSSTGNAGPALVVKSSLDVAVTELRSRDDTSGIAVLGTSERLRVSDAAVSGGETGVRSSPRTTALQVTGSRFTDLRDAGLDLSGEQLLVEDTAVVRASTGVDFGGAVAQATVRDVRLHQVTTGLVAKKQARGVELDGVRVTGAEVGMAVAAADVTVNDGTLRDVKTGLRVYGAARDVAVTGLRVTDAGVGVLVTSSTTGVSLRGLDIDQETGVGVSSSSSGLRLAASAVEGGLVGLDLHGGPATVEDVTVRGVQEGIRLGREGDLALDRSRIDGVATALRTAAGSVTSVTDSRLWGLQATTGSGEVSFTGENDLPPTPLPWYSLAGIIAVLSAVGLETVRRLREVESDWAATAAAYITNRS